MSMPEPSSAAAPQHRPGAGHADGGVPRHLDLEDPLSRGRGPDHAGAGAVGLPALRAADVERLRYVLSVQREHYLPLKVIREHLDADGPRADAAAAAGRSRPPRARGNDGATAPGTRHRPRRRLRRSSRSG